MKILLDMDEVIEDMTHHWVETLNCIHGLSVSFEDVNEWDMSKAYPTLDEDAIYNPLHLEAFWNNVKLLPGAKEGINKLLAEGHNIYVVTSSHPNTVSFKAQWLEKHLPEIPWQNVIIARDKSMVDGDVLVDDGLHNLYEGNYRKILFDKPWNQNIPLNHAKNIIRAYNWEDVISIILNLTDININDD